MTTMEFATLTEFVEGFALYNAAPNAALSASVTLMRVARESSETKIVPFPFEALFAIREFEMTRDGVCSEVAADVSSYAEDVSSRQVTREVQGRPGVAERGVSELEIVLTNRVCEGSTLICFLV